MPLIFIFHEEQYLKSLEFYLYYFCVSLYNIKLSVHFTQAQLAICPDTLPWNGAQYCIHFGHSSFQILFCCYLLCSWWWKQTPVVCSFVKELSKEREPLLIFSQKIRISLALQVLKADFFWHGAIFFCVNLGWLPVVHQATLGPPPWTWWGEICLKKFMDSNKGKFLTNYWRRLNRLDLRKLFKFLLFHCQLIVTE